MGNKIDDFKHGMFSLFTRRFGSVAEFMIEALFKLKSSQNHFHDRFDDVDSKRIEIKFSWVMKSNDEKISKKNIVEQILEPVLMVDKEDKKMDFLYKTK